MALTAAERQRKYRQDHPERVAAGKRRAYSQSSKIGYRDRNLRRRYGITYDQLVQLHTEQGGVCAICGDALTVEPGEQRYAAHVDHDHATGKVRGLLCNFCNRGLGYFLDDAARLRAAAVYIDNAS